MTNIDINPLCLQNIVYKYTQVIIPPGINQLVDHTSHINNYSAFVLYAPIGTAASIYVEQIINNLHICLPQVIFFVNGSNKYFTNHKLPGLHIHISSHDMCHIIDEYYCERPKYIVGVTGTCGKTSTCTFLYHSAIAMDIKATLLTSLGMEGLPIDLMPHHINTTYSNLTLKRIIHNSALRNIQLIILEVSSHGIKQNRIKDINFDGVIWTGFQVDHLEYHPTLEDYFTTKKAFVMSIKHRIINEQVYDFIKAYNTMVLDYNVDEVFGEQINAIHNGGFTYNKKIYNNEFTLKFYQRTNLLGALILLHKLGYMNALNYNHINVQLPSRMELFGHTHSGAPVYSDQAYRPDNIRRVINDFNVYNLKRLILIIGAGGDRNRGINYRRDLGELGDKVYKMIITDDNPRSENPNTIRQEIMGDRLNIWNIPSRFDALQVAFSFSNKEHIILILSHGNEETVRYKNYYSFMGDKEALDYHLLMKMPIK